MSGREPFRGGKTLCGGHASQSYKEHQELLGNSSQATSNRLYKYSKQLGGNSAQELHPSNHLRGKQIGMWYRQQQQARNVKAAKEVSSNETCAQKNGKKTKYYQISFPLEREEKIEKYLNTVKEEALSASIPLSEYRKRLKITHSVDNSDIVGISQNDSILEKGNSDKDASKMTEETFYSDFCAGSMVKQYEVEIKQEPGRECSSNESDDLRCSSMKRQLSSLEFVGEASFMDSIVKYEYLEESPFRRRFLSSLSSNIQEKLQNIVSEKAAYSRRIEELDEKLYQALRSKEKSAKYQTMLRDRKKLPAFQAQSAILDLIEHNQVILLSGETGCGKTTQVAQFILDEAIRNRYGSSCNIICTQPRRISAISVAQRVSDERVELLGHESVGYQIRLEKKIGRERGSIVFCTTGIVLQKMQGDPALSNYSHIILDEIHERDTLCDFTMAILKDVVMKRKDLKIILMSATLNADRFSTYFGDCPCINIPGYTYPVQEYYLEDVLLSTGYRFDGFADTRRWKKSRGKNKNGNIDQDEEADFNEHIVPYAESLAGSYPEFVIEGLCNPESERVNVGLIVALIKHICVTKEAGAILVFVPGWEVINQLLRKMEDERNFFRSSSYWIIPLHSMLPTTSQLSVFYPPPRGIRKIVLATNIAETSITINDVVYVIDCGHMKVKNYDVDANISTLTPEFVSVANARQRRGRAGRVRSGICYHLFSRAREKILADHPLPEMLRTRLEEVILNVKILQLGKAAPFLEKVMDPPNPEAVSLAVKLLVQMNALDENENLTPLGFHLAKLPLHPQIGKMLLMAVTLSCLNPILSIAAALTFKEPFQIPLGEEYRVKKRKLALDKGFKSDHLILAEVMDCWESLRKDDARNFCWYNYLNDSIMRQLHKQKLLLAQYLVDLEFLNDTDYKQDDLNVNSDNVSLLKAVICSGFYPNVVIIKRQINTSKRKLLLLMTSEDGKVNLHTKSVNTIQKDNFEDFFLVYHEKLLSSNIFIHDTTMVPTLPLFIFCNDLELRYDSEEKATIELNKDLLFECSRKTAHCITELKLRFHQLVEYKLSHPDQVLWKDNTSEVELLRTHHEVKTNFQNERPILSTSFNNLNRMLTELFTHEQGLVTERVTDYN